MMKYAESPPPPLWSRGSPLVEAESRSLQFSHFKGFQLPPGLNAAPVGRNFEHPILQSGWAEEPSTPPASRPEQAQGSDPQFRGENDPTC